MAAQITDQPDDNVRPAGQALIFTISDSPVPDRYVAQVFRSTSRTSIGSNRGQFFLQPNPQNVAHFDLSQIAQGLLEVPMSKNSVIIHSVREAATKAFTCDNGLTMLRFTVRPGSYTGTTTSMNSSEDAVVFLLPGVEQTSAGYKPSFGAYYPDSSPLNKVWLTERRFTNDVLEMYLGPTDDAVAMFVNNQYLGGAGDLVGYVAILPLEGSSYLDPIFQPITTSDTVRDNYWAVPVGPNSWSFWGVPSNADSILVYLQNSAGTAAVSKAIRVFKKCMPSKHESTQVAWFNTRGGYDYLTFTGRSPKVVTTEGKTYRRNVRQYGLSTFRFEDDGREYATYAKTGKEQYTLTTNDFNEVERDLVQYLLRSKVVHIRRGDGDWLPATVLTNSVTIEPAGSQLYNVSLTVEVAEDIRC